MRLGVMRLVTPLRRGARFGLSLLALSLLGIASLHAQQVGTNVNMVTGTQWPGGDPFLQRQNEPSMAISSRNPLHMVAGDNDYRSVDLPGVSGEVAPTGDAWLGWFTSFDGGQTWSSILVPGYPQDTSLAGKLSPIHGLGAGADPMVRAGTNGMFYYSGLAFNRQAGGASKVFVATYTDDNDLEGGNSIRYLWTTTLDTGTSNLFEDKPAIAVDIPRSWSGICLIPALPLKNTQIFRAGTVYAAWTQFTGPETNAVAAIMFSESVDCGLTWSHPVQISGTAKTNQGAALAIDPNTGALYITWRVFASTRPTQADAIMYVASFNGGATFTTPALVADIDTFDQGETVESFRTNDYPTIAVDDASHAYVVWSQRDVGNATTLAANGGDARIVVATGTPTSNPSKVPLSWSTPLAVDPYLGRGHQIMPGMAFSAGKLTVAWYDLRYDDELAIYTALESAGQFSEQEENDGGAPNFPSFGTYIQDPAPPYPAVAERQTLDVRAAQSLPGDPPAFFPSVQVTEYPYGSVPPNGGSINPTSLIQQLQVDPPNLPMFQSGTLPFFGDYIDVAGPTFIPLENGGWRFNNLATDSDFTHVVWTDNRDVVPPADGNWANYTPPTYPGSRTSIFDPTQTRPACSASTPDTGDRNQNIYTAQLAPGLVLSSPGNSKQLGTGSNGQLIQRQFAIVVTNTTAATQYYELTIAAQPTGGAASFLQFAVSGQPFPLTEIQVEVPALSSTSRGIFVTSTVANATVTVTAAQLTALNGNVVSGGETGSVTINSDPNNPASQDTNIASTENYTPTIATPNIANPNIANPNIANPNIANPNIANPNIANPNIANPNIANPNIANPNIANPNIANPNIANTDLSDGTITDATYAVTNTGNTSSAYSVNLIGQSPPAGIVLQVIVYGNYTTPLVTPASGCTLITESHFVPVTNIISPTFSTVAQLFQPAANNPTLPGLALKPGETKYVTLRVYDPTTSNPAQALLDYNPTNAGPAVVSQGANTGTTTPPVTLTIVTKSLPQATLTGLYPSQTLQATGGSGAYTWSLFSGTLPTGIALSSAGVLSGTPTGTAATYSFTVQVKDAASDIAQQALKLVVNPVAVISPATLAAATQSEAYSQVFSVSPETGTAPFTWSATGLPSWLTFTPATAALSGTAASGSYSFTIKVTDVNGVAASTLYTLLVNPAPVISPASLAAATQSESYSQTFSVSNGTAPFTWSASGLPSWLTFTAATATLSGTAASGSYSFTIKVTDVNGVAASTLYTLLVNPAPVISPATLAATTQGAAYSQTFSVSTGTAPFTWSASGLPSWLTFTAATATLSGTAASGSYSFTIKVTDVNGVAASTLYTLTVNPALTSITVAPAPHTSYTGDTVYVNYDWPGQGTVLYSGGSALVAPGGTTFNAPANGVTVNVTGTSIVVTFPDGWSFDTTPVSLDGLAITDPLATITGVSLASTNITGFTGSASQLFFDGNDVYINFPHPAFSSLPAGSTLSVSVSFAASAPAAPYSLPGGSTEQFTATGNYSSGPPQNLTGLVTWGASSTPSGAATITTGGLVSGVLDGSSTITATLGAIQGFTTITTPSLVSIAVTPAFPAIAGTNTQQFTATGTYSDSSTQNLTNSVTWASSVTGVATITSGGLAAGVTPGTTTISATLSRIVGNMQLTVNAASSPTITTAALPNGQYNSPYAPLTLSASGGTSPYTWSLGAGGVLPAGMTLGSSSGIISGTPGQAGQWSVPITVTDANSLTANTTLSLTVGLATGYAGSGNCYMPYPTTPMYYLSNGTAGPWSVTAGALSGEMAFLPSVTVTVAGYVNTNGTSVTWVSNQGGQNDQFYLSPTPSSITINNVAYPVASVNSATTLTLAQSAGVQSFVPYSYVLPAGGNMLTGCLSGEAITSGSYQLQLTAGTSTFTLPLQVVAADTQDNLTVNVNSGSAGHDVPPSGFQQGVVTSGQNFTFLPGSYAPDSGFSGNALFGFTGTPPQLCGTFQNVPNSLTAASQAGRFDIAVDGTTQGCEPIPAFPTSPAPIVFESVDTLPSSTFFGGAATISSVVFSESGYSQAFAAASNVLEIPDGGTNPNAVTVAFNYTINDTGCPGCIDQLQVGLNTDASPQTYAYNGGSFNSGSASVNINVPNTPGRYYIAIDFAEDYGFLYSSAYWANGQPTVTRYIGVVDVW
jgi:Putative Ig domain